MKNKFRVKVDGKEYVVEVEKTGEEEEGKDVVYNREDKTKSTGEKLSHSRKESITTVKKSIFAPMPARVTKVNCKKGESVRNGEILIILEAMKMENEIRSSVDGVIKEIRVEEGKNVSRDELMIEFEQ